MADETAAPAIPAEAPPPKPSLSAYLKLRRRLQVWVDLYVETGSRQEALRRMGYKGKPKSLNNEAWRIINKPGVKEAIAEREAEAIAEAGITKVLTLRQIARVGFFDHRKLFDVDGAPLPIHQLPVEISTALLGVEVEELFEGRGEDRKQVGRIHKYRIESRVEALKVLAQYQRLLVERHEHTGEDGGPIKVEDARARNLSLIESLARRAAGAPDPSTAGEPHSSDDAGGGQEVPLGLAGMVGKT